jgi:hypothetical protein
VWSHNFSQKSRQKASTQSRARKATKIECAGCSANTFRNRPYNSGPENIPGVHFTAQESMLARRWASRLATRGTVRHLTPRAAERDGCNDEASTAASGSRKLPPVVPAAENASSPALQRLLLLLMTPGTGQVRAGLSADSVRAWSDPQLTSHVAFVPGIALALAQPSPLPELAALQTTTLALSLAYHRNYERPGLLAQGEGASAKLLFIYGTTQTFLNPPIDQNILQVAEGGCFALTLGCFVATNFDKSLYERWHPLGLHVVPGIWSFLVAVGHTSLLGVIASWAFT